MAVSLSAAIGEGTIQECIRRTFPQKSGGASDNCVQLQAGYSLNRLRGGAVADVWYPNILGRPTLTGDVRTIGSRGLGGLTTARVTMFSRQAFPH